DDARGEGTEAAARRVRYAAFAENLAEGEWLVLGHHRDDQIETVLLKLLRGADQKAWAACARCVRSRAGCYGGRCSKRHARACASICWTTHCCASTILPTPTRASHATCCGGKSCRASWRIGRTPMPPSCTRRSFVARPPTTSIVTHKPPWRHCGATRTRWTSLVGWRCPKRCAHRRWMHGCTREV